MNFLSLGLLFLIAQSCFGNVFISEGQTKKSTLYYRTGDHIERYICPYQVELPGPKSCNLQRPHRVLYRELSFSILNRVKGDLEQLQSVAASLEANLYAIDAKIDNVLNSTPNRPDSAEQIASSLQNLTRAKDKHSEIVFEAAELQRQIDAIVAKINEEQSNDLAAQLRVLNFQLLDVVARQSEALQALVTAQTEYVAARSPAVEMLQLEVLRKQYANRFSELKAVSLKIESSRNVFYHSLKFFENFVMDTSFSYEFEFQKGQSMDPELEEIVNLDKDYEASLQKTLETSDVKFDDFKSDPIAVLARTGSFVSSVGTKLYVWGGAARQHLDSGASFDVLTGEWLPLPSSPLRARVNSTGGSYKDKLVVFGGYSNIQDSIVGAVFDTKTRIWTPIPSPTESYVSSQQTACSVIMGSKLFVIGFSQYSSFSYDLDVGAWTKVLSPPDLTDTNSRCAVVDSKIILMQMAGNSSFNVKVLQYAPETNTWNKLPRLPINNFANLVSNGDRSFIMGRVTDYQSNENRYCHLCEWKIDGNTLKELVDGLKIDQRRASAVLVGPNLFMFGGFMNGWPEIMSASPLVYSLKTKLLTK